MFQETRIFTRTTVPFERKARLVPYREEAVEKVSAIKTERGLALADIARLLCDYVFRLHMPPSARAELVSLTADVEHRLAYVTHERLQLLALVGAFARAKEAIVRAAE